MEKEKREKAVYAGELQDEGKKLFFENRIKEAIDLTRHAADLFEELEDWQAFTACLNSIGVFYDALGNYDLSGSYYVQALNVAESHELSIMRALIYNNIGSEFQDFQNSERASACFALSMESLSPEDYEQNTRDLALILNMNLSESYARLGQMDLALEYLDRARTFMESSGQTEQTFSFKAFESMILWKVGREDYVRAHLDELVNIALNCVNVVDFKENIQDVCEPLFGVRDYDRLRKVIEHCEASCTRDNVNLKLATLDLWIRYYEELGDREGYLEKCEEYYKELKWKTNNENSARSDSLSTKMELRKAENEREQANTILKIDTLTGIGNRNALLEDSRDIIRRSVEEQIWIGIGLLDIDFFKECNDTYGHVRGDECLQKIAGTLQETLGETGRVYRFGGDEFLLLFEGTDSQAMLETARRIKDNIEALRIPNEKSPISDCVTVSQGYTLAVAEEGDAIEHLADLADHVLYKVKRGGRNNYRYMKLGEIIAGSN